MAQYEIFFQVIDKFVTYVEADSLAEALEIMDNGEYTEKEFIEWEPFGDYEIYDEDGNHIENYR